MRVAIISDTHLPKGERRLPTRCLEEIRVSDLVLHAGDVCTAAVLEELRAIGPPLQAVHGNVDDPTLQTMLPQTLELELEHVRIAMLHDAGPARGRAARMSARFPSAALVVFGHSHLPLLELAPSGLQLLNPGSPTERRRAPHHTMALATISGGRVALNHVRL